MEIRKIEKPKGMLLQITKKRVAAYARVSTHDEDQLDSLSAQRSHYETLIKGKSEWIYAGVYYDEGITGTSYAHREAFDMEEIAILIEYVDVYDYQLQIHLFGGKAINMTLSAFGKRKN